MLKYYTNGPINALSVSPPGSQVIIAGREGRANRQYSIMDRISDMAI